MLYFVACFLSLLLGICIGLLIAFSGVVHDPDKLKGLEPTEEDLRARRAYKIYTKGDKNHE